MPLLFPLQKGGDCRKTGQTSHLLPVENPQIARGGGGEGSRNNKSGAAYGGHLLLDLLLHNRG